MLRWFLVILTSWFLFGCNYDAPTGSQSQMGRDLMKMGSAGLQCSRYGGLSGMGAMGSGNCTPPPQPPKPIYTNCQPDGSGGYRCVSN